MSARLTYVLLAGLLAAPASAQPLPKEAEREREIARLKATVEASPKDVGSWHDLGSRLREAERWDEAIEAETKAIAVHPRYAVAFFGRGVARMGKRDYPAARADFTAAIGLWESRGGLERFLTEERARDEHVDAYRNRGISSGHEGRFAEAAADLGTALKLRPDDPRLLFEHAHLLEKAGQKDQAAVRFQRAGLIYADGHAVDAARRCIERLQALGARAAAEAVEKKLAPRPRGDELP
jgi:tetratricopeptide (TPR) repeat protein